MLQYDNVMYVFVRRDLPHPNRVVQVGHVVIQSIKNFPHSGEHPYIIVFGVKTEKSLKNTLDFLQERGIMVVGFREPDRNNELTAVATGVMLRTEENSKIFRRYQLLKE